MTDPVIRPDFTAQVIHEADEDDAPACGEDASGSFVAERGSQLKGDMRWCGACLRRVL